MNIQAYLISTLVTLLALLVISGCGVTDSQTLQAMAENEETAAGSISWFKDVEAARVEAAERDAIIMVDVYTDWCHWCKELDKNVFTDQEVINLSKKIVNLKVDAEDNGQGTRIAQEFGVNGYPTILFITADGREVDRIGGYVPPEQFAAQMKRIISGENTYLSLLKAMEDGTLSAAQRVDALETFMSRQKQEQAAKIAAELKPNDVKDPAQREKAYLLLADYNFAQQNYENAETLLTDYVQAFPDSEVAPRAYLFIVIANVHQNDAAGARSSIERLKQLHPDQKQLIARAEQTLSEIS